MEEVRFKLAQEDRVEFGHVERRREGTPSRRSSLNKAQKWDSMEH